MSTPQRVFPELERFSEYMEIYNGHQPAPVIDPATKALMGVAPTTEQAGTASGKARKTMATRKAKYGPGAMTTDPGSQDGGTPAVNLPMNPNYNANDYGVNNT